MAKRGYSRMVFVVLLLKTGYEIKRMKAFRTGRQTNYVKRNISHMQELFKIGLEEIPEIE